MRIREIEVIGLVGATPEGGWSNELKPDDSVHTLVVVRTDGGVEGYGGAFTNAGLVRAAVAVLESLWRDEAATERRQRHRRSLRHGDPPTVPAANRRPRQRRHPTVPKAHRLGQRSALLP